MKNYSPAYIEDVLPRFAFHSSAIEGNTISLADTVRIFEGTLPLEGGHKIEEFYEIKNHREAFEYVIKEAENNMPYSPMLVRNIHALIMDNLLEEPGKYKQFENYIVGAEFKTAEPFEVGYKIKEWCESLNKKLEVATNLDEKIEILFESHIQFERIHPFQDGNGRTGRLLLNYELIRSNEPLIVIEKEMRNQYISFEQNNDIKGFLSYANKLLSEEKERMSNINAVYDRQHTFEQKQLEKIKQEELKNISQANSKQAYIDELKTYLKDGEFSETDDLNETIYIIDDLKISGDFDMGVRGLDHNSLIFDNQKWEDILTWGTVVVPETQSYISDKPIQELETQGFHSVPLNDNHIIKVEEVIEQENKVSQNPLKEKQTELKNLQKEVKQEEKKLSEKIQGQLHNFVKQSPQAKAQEQNNQQEQSQEEDNGLHM